FTKFIIGKELINFHLFDMLLGTISTEKVQIGSELSKINNKKG
ncbi:MAG: hypothetical protein QG635_88, partial [Bacteroidota bacterium]|nr:hypothetical protein [Bacteroidota bacterium]